MMVSKVLNDDDLIDNKISTAALGGSISIWDVNQGTGAKLSTKIPIQELP
jgi:hypothetical protein